MRDILFIFVIIIFLLFMSYMINYLLSLYYMVLDFIKQLFTMLGYDYTPIDFLEQSRIDIVLFLIFMMAGFIMFLRLLNHVITYLAERKKKAYGGWW